MLWRVFGKRCSSLKAGTTMERSRRPRRALLSRVLGSKGGEVICARSSALGVTETFGGRRSRAHIVSPCPGFVDADRLLESVHSRDAMAPANGHLERRYNARESESPLDRRAKRVV